MSPKPTLLSVVAALWLWAAPAQAEPHRVCLHLDIGDLLWDASPRAADGHDFREEHGRNEGPTSYPAQRWLARVRLFATGEPIFGWDPLDAAGCADVELPDGGEALTLEWLRWAAWDDEPETGNQLVGYHCRAETGDCTLEIQRETLVADPSGITHVVVPAAADGAEINTVLWSATFAEERFASMGQQPLWNTRVYVAHDPGDMFAGGSHVSRIFGNQPSAIIDGDSWHSKYTTAHEYGHLQTMLAHHDVFTEADFDYCWPKRNPCAGGDHSIRSREWQSAAAIEGLAAWYSVSTWHDVDAIECQNCLPGVVLVQPASPTEASELRIPRGDSLCDGLMCPPGVSNEWDWASALRIFRTSAAPPPSFRTMFTMLAVAFGAGAWAPSGPDFWPRLDGAMVGHLGASHPTWSAAAAQMGIDR